MLPSRVLFLSVICASPSFATDALDLARWAPRDSDIVLTWQGADAAAPAFNKTQFGQLCTEPEIIKFVGTPLAGLLDFAEASIRHENKDAEHILPVVRDVLSRLWRHPGLVCVFPARADGDKPQDWPVDEGVAIVWEMGSDASVFFQTIADLIKEGDATTRRDTIGGASYLYGPDAPIYLGQQGDRWLLAFGRDAARKIAEQQKPEGPSFVDTPSHQRALTHFKEIQNILYLNVRIDALSEHVMSQISKLLEKESDRDRLKPEQLQREIPLGIAGVLGLTLFVPELGSREFAEAFGFEGPYLRNTAYAEADPEWSIAADFIRTAPLDLKKLDLIPVDAISATFLTWDPSALYRQTLLTAEKLTRRLESLDKKPRPAKDKAHPGSANPGPHKERSGTVGSEKDLPDKGGRESPNAVPSTPGWLAKELKQQIGIDIDAEILQHLGSHVLRYESREFIGASLSLLIELKDAKAFERQIDSWLKRLPPQIVFKSQTVGERSLHVLDLSGTPLSSMALSPCYAVTDNWLFLSSTQACGRRFLSLLSTPEDKTFTGREDIKKFLAEHQGEQLTSITFSDESATLQAVYPSLAMFYPLMTQGIKQAVDNEGHDRVSAGTQPAGGSAAPKFSIDFAPLPNYDTLNRHMLTTISYAKMQGDLRVSLERDGVPTSASLGAVAGGSMAVAILLPSLARARELAKRTVCAANLTAIDAALRDYAKAHDGRFPDSLDSLLKTGAITQKTLVCPSSADMPDKGGVSYIYIAGLSTGVYSKDVVVYEKKNHEDEGGNVLFADGHVEFVTPYPRVEKLARDTRGRIPKKR